MREVKLEPEFIEGFLNFVTRFYYWNYSLKEILLKFLVAEADFFAVGAHVSFYLEH